MFTCQTSSSLLGCQVVPVVKNSPANPRHTGLIPGSGISPGRGNGTPLQYSCQKNSMDRGAWWATAHRAAKSGKWLSVWAAAADLPSLPSCPRPLSASLPRSRPPCLTPLLPPSQELREAQGLAHAALGSWCLLSHSPESPRAFLHPGIAWGLFLL